MFSWGDMMKKPFLGVLSAIVAIALSVGSAAAGTVAESLSLDYLGQPEYGGTYDTAALSPSLGAPDVVTVSGTYNDVGNATGYGPMLLEVYMGGVWVSEGTSQGAQVTQGNFDTWPVSWTFTATGPVTQVRFSVPSLSSSYLFDIPGMSLSAQTPTPSAPLPGTSGVGLHGATVSWGPVNGATSYTVSLDGATVSSAQTATSFAISGLSPSTSYAVSVTAADSAGSGQPGTAQFTTGTPTGIPVLSATTNSSGPSVGLTWTQAVAATAYQVFRGPTLLSTQASTTYTDRGVAFGTPYSYHIVAVGPYGDAASRDVSVTVAEPVLAPPVSLRSGRTATGGATVAWAPAPGAPSGIVYRVTQGGRLMGTTSSTSFSVAAYDQYLPFGVQATHANFVGSSLAYAGGLTYGLTVPIAIVEITQAVQGVLRSVWSYVAVALALVAAPLLIRLIRAVFRPPSGRSRRGTATERDYRRGRTSRRPGRDSGFREKGIRVASSIPPRSYVSGAATIRRDMGRSVSSVALPPRTYRVSLDASRAERLSSDVRPSRGSDPHPARPLAGPPARAYDYTVEDE